MKQIKNFDEFISEGIVKKQNPDFYRAEFLINSAKNSFKAIIERVKNMVIDDLQANSIIKDCYDILLELIRAEMLKEGYSSSGQGAHEGEVSYSRFLGLKENDVQLLDELRYSRNGITYYGKICNKEYAEEVYEFMSKTYRKLRLISIFKNIQKIPYRVSKFEPEKLDENLEHGDCRHKSELLYRELKNEGFEVKKLKVIFDWKDLPIPKNLLSILKNSGTIWDHDAVSVNINNNWIKLDCTWNLELEKKRFPMTKNWNGESDTKQVTEGKLEFYEVDKYVKKIKIDKKEALEFAEKLNEWMGKDENEKYFY